LLINRSKLAVGRDVRLQSSPEVIHRVQLGALLREPDQTDGELCRQLSALHGVVTRCPIQQHVEWPLPVSPPQEPKKRLEIVLAHLPSAKHDPVAGPKVDRPEQGAFGILARDSDAGLLAAPCPHRAQGREQSQRRFIFKENDGILGDPLQEANDSPFF
jgi:hypothetical protein